MERIISGGQTGPDRAALDFAIAKGIPHGGWCPKERLAEDGKLAGRYRLDETQETDYAQRTEWNVRDSDGTVVFSISPRLSGGSEFTAEVAKKLNKPCLHLSKSTTCGDAATRLREFVSRHRIRVLNIAGPRASNEPDVKEYVRETLEEFFRLANRPWR